jgi:CHAD domain-containing protein
MTTALPRALATHLAEGVRTLRRRYRKRLERCQHKFSETVVHDLRIETRRLLAMLDLLRALRFSASVRKPRKALKRRLDAFDDLRDAQVGLALLKRRRRDLPEARAAVSVWHRRERRLIAGLRRPIKAMKQARLQKRFKSLEKALRASASRQSRRSAAAMARAALRDAFGRVAELRQRMRSRDTWTIHRTRVAFKRFRYMCELLQPLLPGMTQDQLERMRAFQALMGDVQDIEVLLTELAAAVADGQLSPVAGRRLRAALLQRRRDSVARCMAAADELSVFDPARLAQPGAPTIPAAS